MLDVPIAPEAPAALLRRETLPAGAWREAAALLDDQLAGIARDTARDWGVEVPRAATPTGDMATLRHSAERLALLTGGPGAPVLDYRLRTGVQLLGAPYDRDWATGAGLPWSHVEGDPFVMGRDGFSAAGFGLHLSVTQEALVSIQPQGRCRSSWAALEAAPGLRSRAGAGVVVHDGTALIVSRQPVLWDLRDPAAFTGANHDLPFADVASPPLPGSFGPPRLGPVLVRMEPGRRYLVWFYTWHVGSGIAGRAFLSFVTATVPLVTAVAGPVPVIK